MAIRKRGSWRRLVLLEKQRTGICSGDRGAQTKRRLKGVARRYARTQGEVLVGMEDCLGMVSEFTFVLKAP